MTTTIKAMIIDDEPLACSLLQFMLQSCPEVELLHIAYSPQDAMVKIDELKPDLIFLDIQMPQITGIELLGLIEHQPQVIFTTAFNEHALKAFDLNAVDYLLKPYSTERLQIAIQKVQRHAQPLSPQTVQELNNLHQESRERLIVKDKKQMKIIPFQNIYYLEGAQDYVKIYTTEGVYIKHGTMQSFEDFFKHTGFLRCHRSYIVNTQYIHSIQNNLQKYTIILNNQTQIPVSRNKQSDIKAFLKA